MWARSHLLQFLLPLALALSSALLFRDTVHIFETNVGLYHDALWDFIPAVAMVRNESIARNYEVRNFHRYVPIVTSPYSGATKVWALAPVVRIFPMTPRVIITTNVILGFLYLLALYWALVPLVGRIWASAAFAVPFVDTNFLITTPIDVGITITQYIFVSLALGAFFRYVSNPQLKYYRAACFLFGCVLAQKLTAFPIVIALMVVLTLVAFQHFMEAVRESKVWRAISSYFLVPAALFLAPLVFQIMYFVRHGFSDLKANTADGSWVPFFPAIRNNFAFFFTLFDGWDSYRRLTLDDRRELIQTPYLAIFGLAVIALSLAIYFLSRKERKNGRNSALCFAVGALGFLLFPAFRGLYRPWHFFVLVPLFVCCVVTASCHVFRWLGGRRYAVFPRAVLGATLIFVVAASSSQGLELLKELRSHKGVCISSPAFYDLYNSILRSKVKRVYAVNYSIAFPIYVFSKGRIRVVELAWTQLTADRTEDLIRKVKADPDSVIAYRQCGCKQSEPAWVEWLNRESELPGFIKRLGQEGGELNTVRFHDARQTEFFLVSRKGRPIF